MVKDIKINRALLTKRQLKILDSSKHTPGWIYSVIQRKQGEFARWRKPGTPFFVGQKQVFLPNFTITLLRTPNLPATTAQFLVPLNINKLDLRDYLYHAYSVRVFSIRSFVKLSPIRQVEPGSARDLPGKRRHYRPRATKKMIVTLEKPFVWPEEPKEEEMGKWDQERYRKLESARERQMNGRVDEERRYKERVSIAEQAQRLLEGKDRWKGVDPSVLQQGPVGGGRSFSLPVR